MFKTTLYDGRGTNSVQITTRGQLVTAPLSFSSVFAAEANVINTAFNLTSPQAGKRFVLTDVMLFANKGVGVNDATIELYEATAVDTITVDRSILLFEMLKQSSRDLTGLNLICSEGRWINIKTNDTTIFANIMGYFVTV